MRTVHLGSLCRGCWAGPQTTDAALSKVLTIGYRQGSVKSPVRGPALKWIGQQAMALHWSPNNMERGHGEWVVGSSCAVLLPLQAVNVHCK